MAIEGHLSGLNSKHKQLEERIEKVRSHPSADPLELAQLKREKLKIKDELERLQPQST